MQIPARLPKRNFIDHVVRVDDGMTQYVYGVPFSRFGVLLTETRERPSEYILIRFNDDYTRMALLGESYEYSEEAFIAFFNGLSAVNTPWKTFRWTTVY